MAGVEKKPCVNCDSLVDVKIKVCPECCFAYPTKTSNYFIKFYSIVALLILFISIVFPPLILLEFGVIYLCIKSVKDLKKIQDASLTDSPILVETSVKKEKNITYKINNDGTAIIWEGTTKPASFSTFDKKFQGVITRLILKDDGEFYIDITDTETGEIFTAKEIEIRTKIKVGSTSYDFVTLCRNPLKINLQNMFSFAEEVRSEARKPMLIKTFDPIDVSFIYKSKENGRARRTVTVTKYYRNKQGGEYFEGHCHSRNEERMFKASNMDSKLKVGKNCYFFNEFVDNFVNGELCFGK